MKKIILISVFLVLSFMVSAEWFGAEYAFTFGWSPNNNFGGYERKEETFMIGDNFYRVHINELEDYDSLNSFYTKLMLKFWFFQTFFIGGDITTQMYMIGLNFYPYFTNYGLTFGVKLEVFTLFYERECAHPVMSYAYAYRVTSLWGEGSVNRIGIKISGELGKIR